MEPFAWVSTGSMHKFNRAVLEFKNKNKELVKQGRPAEEITEERVKARYIEMAGKIIEENAEAAVDEESEVADKPRRGRRSNQDAE